MGAVIVLLTLVLVCAACVQLGAIALELTGMERTKARFQAVSAFTNSGYTTREAEEVTRFPVRRRIVSFLMVFGYVGLATFIGTFATSFFERSYAQTAVQGGIVVGSLGLLYLLLRWRGLTMRVGRAVRRWLGRRHAFDAPSVEEMLQVFEGFGIVRVTVDEECELVGKPLSELRLTARRVQILAIERGGQWIAVPQGADELRIGDHLLCYGDEGAIGTLFATRPVLPSEALTP